MNGPEHYRRAEALLDSCHQDAEPDEQGRLIEYYPAREEGVDSIGHSLAAAQVHATLALAAATVDAALNHGLVDDDAWCGATA